LWVKILKFFDADPGLKNSGSGFGMEKSRIRDKHPGSAMLVYVKKGTTVTSYIEKRKFDREIKTEGKRASKEI
jgi:hypothetical protein